MRIAFRADASVQIGTGHVMRCLTLADALRERGAQCTFICRQQPPGHLLDLIRQRRHEAIGLALADGQFNAPVGPPHAHWLGVDWATDAQQTRQALVGQTMDWLVVDHYALDRLWEQALRPHARRIMVIDDLADRPHSCNLLLDQNLGRNARDYGGLLNASTTTLIGPQYALLRPEFAALRAQSLARRAHDPQLKHLLITMGGVDKDNATGQVLDALKICALPRDLHITVVMGPHAPWLLQVQTQAGAMPWSTQVLAGVNNMAKLMANSDLAIGAAGGTAWERCALGLPTLVLVLAENQNMGAKALQAERAAVIVHTMQQLSNRMERLIDGDQGLSFALKKMSNAAAILTDGEGVTRVARKVLSSHV